MLVTRNRPVSVSVLLLAVGVFLTACGPPGPQALLKGRKLLEAGQTAAALSELKTAAALLPTNAAAWNYLGLAYHRSGQWTNAAEAYSRALKLDRDLLEARYNLGCLWLDQENLEAAKSEFTAYTLRRGNAVEGWIKLGSAQLRGRETAAAEKSFREALRVDARNVEALNGLGLVQLQRNRPRNAAESFAEVLKLQPDYGPALLNLATVAQQYLNDRAGALRRYREYLALKPRPADWEAVSAIVRSIEGPVVTHAPPPLPTNAIVQNPKTADAMTSTDQPGPATVTTIRRVPIPKPETKPAATKSAPSTVVVTPPPASSRPQPEFVKLAPPPVKNAIPDQRQIRVASPVVPVRTVNSAPATDGTPPPATEQPGLSTKLNAPKTESKPPPANSYAGSNSDPVPVSAAGTPAARSPGRYAYVSPSSPAAGNRREAELAFVQGRQSQRANRLAEALQSYRRATQLDPAYFEAHYNLGLTAFNLRSFPVALTAWEYALALQPDNSDARYNFTLTLKAANYPQDAADELEKLLALHPDEARGHLTLGNLYATQLRDVSRARRHYSKVLLLDPRNPQAPAIRYWLVANPG